MELKEFATNLPLAKSLFCINTVSLQSCRGLSNPRQGRLKIHAIVYFALFYKATRSAKKIEISMLGVHFHNFKAVSPIFFFFRARFELHFERDVTLVDFIDFVIRVSTPKSGRCELREHIALRLEKFFIEMDFLFYRQYVFVVEHPTLKMVLQ